MRIHGIIQSAEYSEDPPDSGQIEMVIRVQGVGRDQPRRLVIPMEILLENQELEPDSVRGRSFEADVEQDANRKWVVTRLGMAVKDMLERP
jgi:hypothetical protein